MTTAPPPKVGEITTETTHLGRRDAFHVPGVLVRANALMWPGDKVVFTDPRLTYVRDIEDDEEPHAIVDPFIPFNPGAPAGTLFWVFPVPGSTGPVRHDFDVNVKPASPVDDDDDWGDSDTGDAIWDDDDDNPCKGCYE